MHPEILDGPQKSVLALLSRSAIPPGFYLAGGTALALHLGHRKSVALDFFSAEVFTPEELLERLRRVGQLQVRRNDSGTLVARVEGVEVSFIRYQCPMLDSPMAAEFTLRVTGIRDLASMKLSAIMGRGSRRDFVDLYAVCRQGHSLEEVTGWFQKKYRGVVYDRYHLVKSLVYFLDAEQEPMPVMLQEYGWDDVKSYFIGQSERAFRA